MIRNEKVALRISMVCVYYIGHDNKQFLPPAGQTCYCRQHFERCTIFTMSSIRKGQVSKEWEGEVTLLVVAISVDVFYIKFYLSFLNVFFLS